MHSFTRFLTLVLVALGTVAAIAPAAFGQSGTVAGAKSLAPADIACDGSAVVTVTLNAETGLAGNPTDIALVLDRSGSMAGQPLANLKTAANTFVDILDEASDGALNGVIANGSRIAVVSFHDTAAVNVPLTSNANAVKAAINALVDGDTTNHTAAISTGQGELAGSNPASSKKMIIFTDGVSVPSSADGFAAAASAKAAGTEIFAIGLGSVNVSQLNQWATDPDATHVFIAPNSSQLDAIFEALGAAITVPAATNVALVDTVSSHFSVSGESVSKGSISRAGNVLTWTIAELGTESVTLTYTITHDPAQPGGTEAVGSIAYSDAEGKSVSFPNATVNVRGCAASIDLAPATATNELGDPSQASHDVTATVSDDFGDPVSGVAVAFDILTGPNAAAPNGSGTTDAAGEADYSYTAVQGLAGLGLDTIESCFTNGAGAAVCDTATKRWQDTTAPSVTCSETVNPAGKNVPGQGLAHAGQNPDGFFVLGATDAVDPNPSLFIRDSADGSVQFGPYAPGTTIKLTQAKGAAQSVAPGTGAIDWKVKLKGDALILAVDSSGNVGGPVACLVPPAH